MIVKILIKDRVSGNNYIKVQYYYDITDLFLYILEDRKILFVIIFIVLRYVKKT